MKNYLQDCKKSHIAFPPKNLWGGIACKDRNIAFILICCITCIRHYKGIEQRFTPGADTGTVLLTIHTGTAYQLTSYTPQMHGNNLLVTAWSIMMLRGNACAKIPRMYRPDNLICRAVDNPWWVAKEVCEILGLHPQRAYARLDDDEKNTVRLTHGNQTRGNPNKIIVNEPGLYSLILRSRKKKSQTKAFASPVVTLPGLPGTTWLRVSTKTG